MASLFENRPAYPNEMHRGMSSTLVATVVPGRVIFSLFSRDCTAVELLLFDWQDDARPVRIFNFHPKHKRTYHYWHLFVPGIVQGQIYDYRVAGTAPAQPQLPCFLGV